MKYIKLFEQYTDNQINTPAFKKWFGKSKMVGKNGKPLIAYHGTSTNFTRFRDDVGHANDRGYYGKGFYFTFNTNPSWQKLAKGEAGYYGGKIMEVYLKVEKPFDINILSKYNGEDVRAMGYESYVFLKNIAERYPNVAKNITLSKRGKFHSEDDSYEVGEVSASILPKLFKKYENDIVVEPVYSFEEIKSKTAYVKSKAETITSKNKDGKEYTWQSMDDLGRYDKDMSDKEVILLAIIDAIEKYDGVSVNFHPEGLMTRNPEITDAIKAEGYDAILQSESGDELVVFSPTQIKSATDNNGDFDEKNPDITK